MTLHFHHALPPGGDPPDGVLRLVVLQPTPFCNIDCDYCYLPGRQDRQVMSAEVLRAIYRNLFASRLLAREVTIVWHAGEPLAAGRAFYESAFRFAGHTPPPSRQMIHSIQTNGTLIDQGWCDLFKTHSIRVGVSLDGPAFLHNARRKTRSGAGTHDRVMHGIALLQSNEIPFHVITVLTRDHLNHADELFAFYLRNHIQRVAFNIEEIEGAHTSSSLKAEAVESCYRAFLKRLYRTAEDSRRQLRVREFDGLMSFLRVPEGRIEHSFQAAPFGILNVDCRGNFSTFSPELLGMKSSVYGDLILGNVLEDTFESALATEKFRRMNEDVQAGVEACRQSCAYFALCGGGAPANKYWENGSFRSTETMYCRLTKQALVDVVFEELEAGLDA